MQHTILLIARVRTYKQTNTYLEETEKKVRSEHCEY